MAVLEPKGEMLVLRVSEPKAPQYAPSEGDTPQQEYRQPAGPRLGPEVESDKSGA